jgi:hypothetical protein
MIPHVKNSSLRVANSSRYEFEEDSHITYRELFEKLESDIAEIDKHLLEVQTRSSTKTSALTNPTVEYLKASQEYLRALLQKYRKQLNLQSALRWANESLDELRGSSYYGFEYAKRRSDKAIADVKKAEQEFSESLPDVLAAVTKLKDARSRVKSLYPEDSLIAVGQLEMVAAKNSSKPARTARREESSVRLRARLSGENLLFQNLCTAMFKWPPRVPRGAISHKRFRRYQSLICRNSTDRALYGDNPVSTIPPIAVFGTRRRITFKNGRVSANRTS